MSAATVMQEATWLRLRLADLPPRYAVDWPHGSETDADARVARAQAEHLLADELKDRGARIDDDGQTRTLTHLGVTACSAGSLSRLYLCWIARVVRESGAAA